MSGGAVTGATAGPDTSSAGGERILVGPLSLDRYVEHGFWLPGGGALNMAWHWAQDGVPFALLSRIGDDAPGVFLDFLARHRVPHDPNALVVPGPSSSIDIRIRADLQPFMDNFIDGAWAGFRCTPSEEAAIAAAAHVHAVMVEPVIAEVERLFGDGVLARPFVSADFLGFRHYTVERFAATMAQVDLGFVGWPGGLHDPAVGALRDVAHDLGRVVVVTFGAQGVRVFDGRPGGGDAQVEVTAVPVVGTTVGCGDAFIAGFLAAWWATGDLLVAVERGKVAGARATAWRRPLPDEAYGPAAVAALRTADAAAGAGD